MFQIAIHLNSKECMEMARNNSKIMAQRRSIVQMLVIIVTVFAVCWLPINIGKLHGGNKKSKKVNTYFLGHKNYQVKEVSFIFSVLLLFTTPSLSQWAKGNSVILFVFFARVCEYGNCVANPFLYRFASTFKIVHKRIRRLREGNVFSRVRQSFLRGGGPYSVMGQGSWSASQEGPFSKDRRPLSGSQAQPFLGAHGPLVFH